MKKLILAAVFAGAASFAHAGNPSAPTMDESEVTRSVETTSTQLSGVFFPLLIVLILGAAAAS